jgi:hypothetical protein
MSRHGHPKRSPADWHFKFDINFEDANTPDRRISSRLLAICANRADRNEGRRIVIGQAAGMKWHAAARNCFSGSKQPWRRGIAQTLDS